MKKADQDVKHYYSCQRLLLVIHYSATLAWFRRFKEVEKPNLEKMQQDEIVAKALEWSQKETEVSRSFKFWFSFVDGLVLDWKVSTRMVSENKHRLRLSSMKVWFQQFVLNKRTNYAKATGFFLRELQKKESKEAYETFSPHLTVESRYKDSGKGIAWTKFQRHQPSHTPPQGTNTKSDSPSSLLQVVNRIPLQNHQPHTRFQILDQHLLRNQKTSRQYSPSKRSLIDSGGKKKNNKTIKPNYFFIIFSTVFVELSECHPQEKLLSRIARTSWSFSNLHLLFSFRKQIWIKNQKKIFFRLSSNFSFLV